MGLLLQRISWIKSLCDVIHLDNDIISAYTPSPTLEWYLLIHSKDFQLWTIIFCCTTFFSTLAQASLFHFSIYIFYLKCQITKWCLYTPFPTCIQLGFSGHVVPFEGIFVQWWAKCICTVFSFSWRCSEDDVLANSLMLCRLCSRSTFLTDCLYQRAPGG